MRIGASIVFAAAMACVLPETAFADPAPDAAVQFAMAIDNITALATPNKLGFATIWDGNKYVQCHLRADKAFVCEAAGARMQPSLAHVLTADKQARLKALGWKLDPRFGNYVQVFPAITPSVRLADLVIQSLAAGYDADVTNLEVETNSVADERCPPRNGPSQNLAGMINDAPAMAPTAVHACFYIPPDDQQGAPVSLDDIEKTYGKRVTAEVQRLRINVQRRVYFILDTDIGYVQCESQTSPDSIYCEAQSADSWPRLSGVLTVEKVAQLHALGYADPGRAPNYAKTYPLAGTDDAALARELLTILHDVYGYVGAPALKVSTEKGDE